MTEDIISGWVSANTKPVGGERKMLLRVVKRDWVFTGVRETEIVIGWWRPAPGCFALDHIENANHLVVYWSWIDLSEPTDEMIGKEWTDRIK